MVFHIHTITYTYLKRYIHNSMQLPSWIHSVARLKFATNKRGFHNVYLMQEYSLEGDGRISAW
jgi:hypothetical protein